MLHSGEHQVAFVMFRSFGMDQGTVMHTPVHYFPMAPKMEDAYNMTCTGGNIMLT